jgi:hypothetical protein
MRDHRLVDRSRKHSHECVCSDPEAVYTTAPVDDGSPCGLFCHR